MADKGWCEMLPDVIRRGHPTPTDSHWDGNPAGYLALSTDNATIFPHGTKGKNARLIFGKGP